MTQTAQRNAQPTFPASQWKLGATFIIYYRTESITDPALRKDAVVNPLCRCLRYDAGRTAQEGERQTLGGLVYHVSIDSVMFDSGLTDKQAVIVISATIMTGDYGM